MTTENGQAASAPETLDSLAAFLDADNPDKGPEDEEDEQQTGEAEPEEGNSDDAEAESGDPDEPEDEESKDEPDQATQKFTVTVKGEDGTDQTVEVDQKELVDGYLRRRDYTTKTMQLAERERQAVEVVTRQLNEGRSHFLEQAQIARSAVLQLAGLKTPEEMAQLAVTNQQAWVEETQRASVISQFLQRLDGVAEQEKKTLKEQQDKAMADLTTAAATKLRAEGFDPAKLTALYSAAGKKYGWTEQDFANISDARIVLMMRDAMAFQSLKDKKPEPAKKTAPAALPKSKQPVPRSERVNRDLNKRFQSGRARTEDLASFIANNHL